MEAAMLRQPAELERLFSDSERSDAAAARIAGRRTFLVGTGTSWHAANQGAYFLRRAGMDAWAVQAFDAAQWGPRPTPADALVLLSHRNTKRYATAVLERARDSRIPVIVISGRGVDGVDLPTVDQETSSAFTISHLGALARLAQLAIALGAHLGDIASVPDEVAAALDDPAGAFDPPRRGVDFIGAGVNEWTAAEAALKIRETSRVYASAYSVEQFLHGPSVALEGGDALVAFDGGGAGEQRLVEVLAAASASGVDVHRISRPALGELLSAFPLTAIAQRIALNAAVAIGTDPDAFGFDVPGREEAWGAITL
jgi:glucosamine--fructose-6-phosphate aminotransferase (isomerizing)